jgi:hypothetical protein
MIAGMVIGLRSGQVIGGPGLAEAVPAADDPRCGGRLVLPVAGDQQPGGDVDGHADAGEQGQRAMTTRRLRWLRSWFKAAARQWPPSIGISPGSHPGVHP